MFNSIKRFLSRAIRIIQPSQREFWVDSFTEYAKSAGEDGVITCIFGGYLINLPTHFFLFFRDGFKKYHHATYPIQLFADRIHNHLMLSCLPIGGVALDIGASGGAHSAIFSKKVGPNGKVYSFEPGKIANALLTKTVYLNRAANVEICPYAIGASDGTSTFSEVENSEHAPWEIEKSSLGVTVDSNNRTVEYQVIVKTLDAFVSEKRLEKIDLVKIDIEGFEVQALEGFRNSLERLHPIFAIDIHQIPGRKETTESKVREILSEFDYEFEKMEHVLFARPRMRLSR